MGPHFISGPDGEQRLPKHRSQLLANFRARARSETWDLPLVIALGFLELLAGFGREDHPHQVVPKTRQAGYYVTSQPVPPHEELIAFVYDSGSAVEPFDPQKMVPRRHGHGGPLQPDLERPREALEDVPLDQIRMVGTMIKGRTISALLIVNGATFKVEIGNHVGHCVVTQITETELFLKETVQNAAGEGVERPGKSEWQILARGG